MLKNTLIKTSGERLDLKSGELSLAEMYAAIGCDTVEHVPLPNENESGFGPTVSSLWCDENALIRSDKQPILNTKASALYRSAYSNNLYPRSEVAKLAIYGNAIHSYHVCDHCQDPRHTATDCPEYVHLTK